jgi:chromatin assembly factor 1 subunit A
MEPPRLPLNTLKSNNLSTNGPSSTASTKTVKPFFTPSSEAAPSQLPAQTGRQKEKKLLPPEEWPGFKDAIRGSDLSKVGLIEVLKKKFPRATAGMVKATLEAVAKRVGKKENEKRWAVIDDGV